MAAMLQNEALVQEVAAVAAAESADVTGAGETEKARVDDTAPPGRWNLSGMRCVVTGSSKGIGLAIAHEMLSLGAHVLITARTEEALDAANQALAAKHASTEKRVHAVAADVATAEGRALVVETARDLWGGVIDVLVNNVGANRRKRVDEASEDDYYALTATNQESAYFLCKLFHPLLKISNYASVVNVSSLAGIRSTGTGVIYAMTKAAMSHMSEALACEWAAEGIRVNCVAPWMARTPMLEAAVREDPNQLKVVCEATPLGRLGEPEDTAATVAFLCMPAARYITGQVVAVDGGTAAQGFKGPCASRA